MRPGAGDPLRPASLPASGRIVTTPAELVRRRSARFSASPTANPVGAETNGDSGMSGRNDVSVVGDARSRDGDCELAFRRSLRGSRARRAAAALRRRRSLRSRCSALVADGRAVRRSAPARSPATAAAAGGRSPGLSKETIAEVQRTLGIDGRRHHRAGDAPRDQALPARPRPEARRPARPAHAQGARHRSGRGRRQRLARSAPRGRSRECESGGDPKAISADGQYRGKYQFDRETWRSVGGRGDPAAAPEREQDRRAARLLARDGTKPWPNCA